MRDPRDQLPETCFLLWEFRCSIDLRAHTAAGKRLNEPCCCRQAVACSCLPPSRLFHERSPNRCTTLLQGQESRYRLVSLASSSTPLDLYLLVAAFQPRLISSIQKVLTFPERAITGYLSHM